MNTVDFRYVLQRAEFSLDVDLQIPMRGITGLFGESGSGKTTLLRCMAGLEQPTIGQLAVDGDVWQDTTQKLSRAIHERQIGYVFQEPRLFSHLDVRGNLEYGRRRKHERESGIEFEQIVELLGLAELLHRATAELSGGEAQRVAIPAAVLGQLVVRDPVGALLRIAPALGDHDRHLFDAKFRRSHGAAVARQELAALVDQHRDREAELHDRRSDLIDLGVRVLLCVPLVVKERIKRSHLNRCARPACRQGDLESELLF